LCTIAVIVSAALCGCATPEAQTLTSCADLSGRYDNQSSPAGHKLAPYFFGAADRAEVIEIVSVGHSTIAISTAKRQATLTVERDFVCAAEGVRLTRTDVRNIRLPPLLVEKEIFHYVFANTPDGALRMTEHVEAHGKSFGIPMGTGQKQRRAEVVWRAVPAR